MAVWIAFALLAAEPAPAAPSHPAPAIAPASASVRILAGARVTLGKSADSGSFQLASASVRLEDGSRRRAQLVEFQ